MWVHLDVHLWCSDVSRVGERVHMSYSAATTKVSTTHHWYGPSKVDHLRASRQGVYTPITDYFLDTNYPLEGSSFQLRGILGEAPTQQQEEWMPQTWGGDLGHTIASTTYLNQILKLDCIACSSEERRLKQSQKIAESSDEAILKITFSFFLRK